MKKELIRHGFVLLLLLGLAGWVIATPYPHILREHAPEWFEQLNSRIELDELDADTSHSYDALHLDILITPDIDNETFNGVVTMTAMSNEDGLDAIIMNLAECFVSGVTVDGADADYFHVDDEIQITLPVAKDSTETFEVTVEYDGPLRDDLFFGGFVMYPYYPILFTFGEPYETRYWLACYDWPYDKVTSTMSVILPEDHTVVSNGVLESEEYIGNELKQTTWENSDPISTYLISIAAYTYTFMEDEPAGVNNTQVTYYVYPDDREEQQLHDFSRTGEMIEVFEGLFGEYPFNKYAQAVAPIFGGWGAMEHQTCTTFGMSLLDGEFTFENIVAHELGHQWWGDWVGPLTFAEIWLNEGFATYSDALWAEHLGHEQFIERLLDFRQQYFGEDEDHRFPIHNPPEGFLFSNTVYEKGALILNTLRWVMGDEDFFDGLQLYGSRYGYGSAVTPDLQEAMEDVSGLDLTDFFEEWVYQAGYPYYIMGQCTITPDGDTWICEIDMEQIQQNAPYFSTPVPVNIVGASESQLYSVPVLPVREQTLVIPGVPFEPTGFTFNDDLQVLCNYEILTGVPDTELELPNMFAVSQGWPNPFNSTIAFQVTVPNAGQVTMSVYDVLGRRVAGYNRNALQAGQLRMNWNPGNTLSSGTYFLRFETGENSQLRSVVFVR